MMYRLEETIYFYTMLIIPVMVLGFFLLQWWKARKQRQFASPRLLDKLSPERSLFKSFLKLGALCLVFALLSVALVNPKIGTKLETVKREGVDIVFAVDVSKSMLAEDIAPNRIEKAKRLVSEIINQLASDRVGIVAYAGKAFPQLPITTDYASAKMFLQGMDTDMLSSQGTAIDQAIRMAMTYYDDEEQTNRILIIISDGEDHSEGAVGIAEDATSQGIKIYTIGVGTPKGARIPIKKNGIVETYKKDRNGEVVFTKLNEKVLMEIAEKGSGVYMDGTKTQEVVDLISSELAEIDKTEFESKQVVDYKDQFQWFLGFAALFLFLDVFLLERKTAWILKLNLFNERGS